MEQPSVDEIIENFELLEEWDDRYRYLIELGRALPPLPEAARNDANKVQGCASQVWLSTSVKPNGSDGPVLTFDGDSDAHIVRGLIAILFALYSGKGAKHILVDRRRRAVREARAARPSHPAALERLPLHGRAHPPRRQRGARGGQLIRTALSLEHDPVGKPLHTFRDHALAAAAALLAEPHLLGELRAGGGVIRRHHRIVAPADSISPGIARASCRTACADDA